MDSRRSRPSRGRAALDVRFEEIDSVITAAIARIGGRIEPVVRVVIDDDVQAVANRDATAADRHRTASDSRELERSVYVLMATQSPVARDLRHALAALRSVNHLQRADRLLGHVGSCLRPLRASALSPDLHDVIGALAATAWAVFDDAAARWRMPQVASHADVTDRSAKVVQLRSELLADVLMGRYPADVSVALGLAGRHLQRLTVHGMHLAQLPDTYAAPGSLAAHTATPLDRIDLAGAA
jgi:phosphate uptake regulator